MGGNPVEENYHQQQYLDQLHKNQLKGFQSILRPQQQIINPPSLAMNQDTKNKNNTRKNQYQTQAVKPEEKVKLSIYSQEKEFYDKMIEEVHSMYKDGLKIDQKIESEGNEDSMASSSDDDELIGQNKVTDVDNKEDVQK